MNYWGVIGHHHPCTMIRTTRVEKPIEGNAGGTFAPGSGMTRVVTTRKKVCRQNGVANDCYLVLSDANPQNGLNTSGNIGALEGDFFGDMS